MSANSARANGPEARRPEGIEEVTRCAQGNLAGLLGASEERADAKSLPAAKLSGRFDRSYQAGTQFPLAAKIRCCQSGARQAAVGPHAI